LITTIFTLNSPAASAFDACDGKDKGATPASASDDSDCRDDSASKKGTNIAYKLYTNVKTAPEKTEQPDKAFGAVVSAGIRDPRSAPAPMPAPRASTAPLSAGEKFGLFLKSSFKPPGPYALSIVSGLFNEALDNNEGKKDTVGDYFADSMTRAARSYGFRVTANFFEKFAYATVLRQDPRYHRSGKKSAGGKIAYAVSRAFITQGDRSGDQPNISYLAGGLTAAAISKYWQREENKTTSKIFSRWGTHIGLGMLSNILREFIGGQ
jgi:hypothetical protein